MKRFGLYWRKQLSNNGKNYKKSHEEDILKTFNGTPVE